MVYRKSARSEAVRDASRDKLLKATLALLARKGYDAMTMQEVVARAGTSIGNAYFYFANKEQLVGEAVASAVDAMLAHSEREAERVAPGPRRLATLLVNNANAVLNPRGHVARVLLATDQRLGTLQMAEDKAIAVLLRQLATCFPERPADELPMVAAAIFGANRTVIQRITLGGLAAEVTQAKAFMLGWSLRALDVPDGEVDAIVRDVLEGADAAE